MKYKIILSIAFSTLVQASKEKTEPPVAQCEQSIALESNTKLTHCKHLAPHIEPVVLQHIVLGYLGWEENKELKRPAHIKPNDKISVVFSPDSHYFATNHSAGITIGQHNDDTDDWDFTDLKLVKQLIPFSTVNPIIFLNPFSPDGTYFATSDKMSTHIWQIKPKTMLKKSLSGSSSEIGFSSDSSYFACIANNVIMLYKKDNDQWNYWMDLNFVEEIPSSSNNSLATYPGLNKKCKQFFEYSRGGILIDNSIVLSRENAPDQIINQNNASPVIATGFSDDQIYFIFATRNKCLSFFKRNAHGEWQEEVQTIILRTQATPSTTVMVNQYVAKTGNTALQITATAATDKYIAKAFQESIQIYSAHDPLKALHTIDNHKSTVYSLKFSPNNQYLVCIADSNSDNTETTENINMVKIWTNQARSLLGAN